MTALCTNKVEQGEKKAIFKKRQKSKIPNIQISGYHSYIGNKLLK